MISIVSSTTNADHPRQPVGQVSIGVDAVAVSPPTAKLRAVDAGERLRAPGSCAAVARPRGPGSASASNGAFRVRTCTVPSAEARTVARPARTNSPESAARAGERAQAARDGRRLARPEPARRRADRCACPGTRSSAGPRSASRRSTRAATSALSDESFMPSAGAATAPRTSTDDRQRSRRLVQRRPQQRRPQPRLAVLRGEPPQHRDARAVDAPAELDQQRGQHGERTQHRHRDDDDRAGRERGEGGVVGEVEPEHRHHHREARHEHRVPGGLGRDLDRVERGCARDAARRGPA